MTTYAVQAMLGLAGQPEGTIVSLRKIADQQGIKAKYLEQIFMKLQHAGLVKSKKGPGGGYYLDRPVSKIKIGQIMAAVGESSAPVRCLTRDTARQCSRANGCSLRLYWKRMKDIIDTFLNTSTLHDIMLEKKNHNDNSPVCNTRISKW